MLISTITGSSKVYSYFKVNGLKGGALESYGIVEVDPNDTKLVQTGLVNSSVPALRFQCYKGVEAACAIKSLNLLTLYYVDMCTSSNFIPPDLESGKLLKMISQYLSPMAGRFDSPLTILLHGPEGSGKSYMAACTARLLGAHSITVMISIVHY
jgi:hypothetical protein